MPYLPSTKLDERDKAIIQSLNGVTRAQARLLWMIVSLDFFVVGVLANAESMSGAKPLGIPFDVIRPMLPPVIYVMTLALHGSFRRARSLVREVRPKLESMSNRPTTFWDIDQNLNVLDFLQLSLEGTPLRRSGPVLYPLFLLASLVLVTLLLPFVRSDGPGFMDNLTFHIGMLCLAVLALFKTCAHLVESLAEAMRPPPRSHLRRDLS